jgi:hypothetical protein
MPEPEVFGLDRPAVLYKLVGYDAAGDMVWENPIQIEIRFISDQADEIAGREGPADITAVVDREVPVDSKIWMGDIEDLPSTKAQLESVTNPLMRVVTYSETPDAKDRVAFRTIGLKRYREIIPNVRSAGGEGGWARRER